MLAILIMRKDDGLPVYFSIAVGRNHGAGMGWTTEPAQATGFARARDAREFAEVYIPMLAPSCIYHEAELE